MACQQEGDSIAEVLGRKGGFWKGVAQLVTGSRDSKDLIVGMRSLLQPQCRKGVGAAHCQPPLGKPLSRLSEVVYPALHSWTHLCRLLFSF